MAVNETVTAMLRPKPDLPGGGHEPAHSTPSPASASSRTASSRCEAAPEPGLGAVECGVLSLTGTSYADDGGDAAGSYNPTPVTAVTGSQGEDSYIADTSNHRRR